MEALQILRFLVTTIFIIVEIAYIAIFIKKRNSKRGLFQAFVMANVVIAALSVEAILNGALGEDYSRTIFLIILWAINAVIDLRWYKNHEED